MKNFHLHLLIVYILISATTFTITEHQTLFSNLSETEDVQPIISQDYQSTAESYNLLVFETIQQDEFDELLLVNTMNPIRVDINSMDMLAITSDMSIRSKSEEYVNPACLNSLEQLFIDAKNLGYDDLIINSAYRDYHSQEALYNNRLAANLKLYDYETALAHTDQYVAMAGYSEHQLGLAVDISSTDLYRSYNRLEDIPSFQWLYENCYKYGLLLRYPKGKENITSIAYEPWHFRYLGQPTAEYIYMQNLCYEEYVNRLKDEEIITFIDENNESYTMYYIDHLDSYDFFEMGVNINNAINISKLDSSSYVIVVWNHYTN
ncbi:M15 family metallopeptidase [Vallitalea okinawensis]|uniref:M15 family metallopeptidase n=1 Tax=Vallitalea okinawensis TaxID=2078660 RepID=UPI000CFB255D|nr:M15 family metallopeptidase [Vallitalea okinawensis]